MSEETTGEPTPEDAKRLPPSPPELADETDEDSPDDVLALSGGTSWLDDGQRRRRRRTPPKGPVDRLRRKWRRWRRHRRRLAKHARWYRPRNIVLGVIGLVLIGILGVLLTAYIKLSDIRRAPLLPVVPTTASIGTNIVLLGSDGTAGALVLDRRTLVVQFIHISANYQAGQVIDLPRDLVLGTGSSAATVQSIYDRSGVAGLVGAIEKAMGVSVSHVVQTSFHGYAEVTDDLGGVSIKTDTGTRPFTGAQAETYAAQINPPGGTIETGTRYQHWSKAMLEATLQPGVLLDPFTLWSVFSHTADNIVVDDTLDNSALLGLVWHLKSLSPSDLHFFTAPNSGYGTFRHHHVLLPNRAGFAQLSTAIRTDNLATIGLFQ